MEDNIKTIFAKLFPAAMLYLGVEKICEIDFTVNNWLQYHSSYLLNSIQNEILQLVEIGE